MTICGVVCGGVGVCGGPYFIVHSDGSQGVHTRCLNAHGAHLIEHQCLAEVSPLCISIYRAIFM